MKDYVIIFKEWDELGYVARRTIRVTLNEDPIKWFWRAWNGGDVDLIEAKVI